MKRSIFVLLCICLLVTASAVFADGEKEGYSVTYYRNNCLAEVPEDETLYQYGEEVEVLFEPVEYMNGLIFHGWDWNDDGIADFGYNYRYFEMPKKDVKLKAICISPYYAAPDPCPNCCWWCHPPFPPAPPTQQGPYPDDTGTSWHPTWPPEWPIFHNIGD